MTRKDPSGGGLQLVRALGFGLSSAKGAALALLIGTLIAGSPGAEAAAARSFRIEPRPGWVESVPVPDGAARPKEELSGGVEHLLRDTQVDVGSQAIYYHAARRIVNVAGLEDGNELSFSWDPAYQRLDLHRVLRYRGEEVRNLLRRDKVQILQREVDLERKLYDGSLSAVLILEDVRVGDVLEYDYTIRGFNPIFGGKFVGTFDVEWSEPLHRLRYRLLWPASRRLYTKNHRTDVQPAVRPRPGLLEFVWERQDVPGILADSGKPAWFDSYGWVQLSEFATWNDVARWAAPLFEAPSRVPAGVTSVAEEIRSAATDPPSRLLRALRFVQNDVRYLAISLGTATHRPHPPDRVLAQRFGDCKDKTYLLLTLLRALGIEAVAVLVNTGQRQSLDAWQPAPSAFNHVLVRATVGENVYWLDGTRSHQGGDLGRLYLPNYRRGLLAEPAATGLTQIPDVSPELSRIGIAEKLLIRDFKAPVTFAVTTTAEGVRADRLREELSGTSRPEIEKSYLDYYARSFPKIAVAKPLEIRDDLARNILVTHEEYRIDDFWSHDPKEGYRVSLYPQEIRNALLEPSAPARAAPLGLRYPDRVMLETEVHLPEDWSHEPSQLRLQNSGFRYAHRSRYAGRVLTLHYEYEALADAVPAYDYGRYRRDVRRVLDSLGFDLTRPVSVAPAPRSALQNVSWPVVATALLLLGISGFAAVRLYNWRFAAPPVLPPASDAHLNGLGGWLILVGFGTVVRPIVILTMLLTTNNVVFKADVWTALTAPGSSTSPWLGPFLIVELLVNVALFAFSVLALVCFFRKKRILPPLMVALLSGTVVFLGADLAVARALVEPAALEAEKTGADLGRAVIGAIIWIPYFLRSRRVRATFVN